MNNQLTKEWLQQTIAELESVRDEIPFGIDTNSELELAAFKLALAAMDSEPVAYTDERNLGYIDRGRGTAYLWGKQNYEASDVALYRHAQPAPVVPEDVRQALSKMDDEIIAELDAEESACRAAMLQAEPVTTANKLGNSPVIPDGYVMVPKVLTEEMIAAAMNCEDVIFNSDDSFCVQFGNIYDAMLAAAPQEVKP